MSDPFATFYENLKSKHGGLASVVFIITSIILFLYDGGLRSLLSVKAVAFILIGMFVAAVAVGAFTYWLQRKIARYLMKTTPEEKLFDQNYAAKIVRIGWVLFGVDILVSALFTLWVYNSLFWT
jgi:hypothetical protein